MQKKSLHDVYAKKKKNKITVKQNPSPQSVWIPLFCKVIKY